MTRNILIGGTAGHGINTLSYFAVRILRNKGYHVHTFKDYMSRVRGGINFTHIRFGTKPVHTHDPKVDIVIALNQEAADLHTGKLVEGGWLICDEDIETNYENVLRIPIKKIGSETKNPRGLSAIATGALIKALGFPEEDLQSIGFPKWSEDMKQKNHQSARLAYDAAKKVFEPFPFTDTKNIYMNGNQAIAMGALAGGLNTYFAYPMAPSTGIMQTLSQWEAEAGILVEQAEDEIAAMNMAIGASATGARAMTGTSGGGFSLMVEALGFAGIGEIPLVAVDVQRPGPATGLPTRTEQSDLSFILSASHGEMPRMVIAVKDVEDAFYQTARALNIAEMYRIPVIILSDQYLADMTQTFPKPDLSNIKVLYHQDTESALGDLYKNYDLSGSLTPRMVPAQSGSTLSFYDSHEHDEYGHITEDAQIRTDMMHRRMGKLKLLEKELIEPDYIGSQSPDYVLIGWGSLKGSLSEAISILNDEGFNVGALVFGDIYPLPQSKLSELASNNTKFINVEMNYTGQLGRLIRTETGISMYDSILKFDGRQLSFEEIVAQVKELV